MTFQKRSLVVGWLLVLLPSFALAGSTVHVDQAAPCAAGDGSSVNPYCTIQEGIDAALPGDTVLVAPGVYKETIDFVGKAIVVASSAGAELTTIHGGSAGSPVVTFANGETQSSVLDGFRITGGFSVSGGGIHCAGSSPIIRHALIVANRVPDFGAGGGLFCDNASPRVLHSVVADNVVTSFADGAGAFCTNGSAPRFTNTTFYRNRADFGAGGIAARNSSTVRVTSGILWDDTPAEISVDASSTVIVTYSDVEGGHAGVGNIDADPLFLDAPAGDLRLSGDSSAVDAGDPDAGGALQTDILGFGHPRIDDGDFDAVGTIDMGAVEFGGLLGDGTTQVGATTTFLQWGVPNGLAALFVGLPGPAVDLGVQGSFYLSGGPLILVAVGNLGPTGMAPIASGTVPGELLGMRVDLQAVQEVSPAPGQVLHWTNLETLTVD